MQVFRICHFCIVDIVISRKEGCSEELETSLSRTCSVQDELEHEVSISAMFVVTNQVVSCLFIKIV